MTEMSTLEQIITIESLDFKPKCNMGKSSKPGPGFAECGNVAEWYNTMVQPCCTKIVLFCNGHKELALQEWSKPQTFTCTTCLYVHEATFQEIILGNFEKL